MTYKFQLNADLKEVWSRLAGDFDGRVSSMDRATDSYPEDGSLNLPLGSTLEEDDRESE